MRKIMFAALVLGATPAMAQEEEAPVADNSGLRLELHAGIERPTLGDTQNGVNYVAKLGSGFVYGGEIGYDARVSDTVTVGPYVSFDAGSADICETYVEPGINGRVCFASKSDLSVGVRAGFAVGQKAEVYLGVGYDIYSTDFSVRETNATTNAVVFNYVNPDSRKGIGISFGGNYNVSNNVYVGLGMRVSELGDFEGTGYDLQRFQGHATLGFRF